METDIVDIGILKTLLEAYDQDITRKPGISPKGRLRTTKLAKQSWPKIEGKYPLKESSYQHTILQRRLAKLMEANWVGTDSKHKNVGYFLLEASVDKIRFLIRYSDETFKEHFLDRLKLDGRTNSQEADTLSAFYFLLKVTLMPFWFRMFHAIVNNDKGSFEDYKREAEKLLVTMFDITSDLFFDSEAVRPEVETLLAGESIINTVLKGAGTTQARTAELWFQKPENKALQEEWLKEKNKSQRETEKCPADVQMKLREKRQEEIDKQVSKVYERIFDNMSPQELLDQLNALIAENPLFRNTIGELAKKKRDQQGH